jgi:hypothetical protein
MSYDYSTDSSILNVIEDVRAQALVVRGKLRRILDYFNVLVNTPVMLESRSGHSCETIRPPSFPSDLCGF